MNYNRIDFVRLVLLLLPVSLRRSILQAVLTAMALSMQRFHVLFMNYRKDVVYRLSHNSQVCYLTAMLNDNFDYVKRRIYITDAEFDAWAELLWKEEFDRPIMLGVFTLQSDRFIGSDSIDFIIHVPFSLNLSMDETARMNSLLRYYKLASKRYLIRRYYE